MNTTKGENTKKRRLIAGSRNLLRREWLRRKKGTKKGTGPKSQWEGGGAKPTMGRREKTLTISSTRGKAGDFSLIEVVVLGKNKV